MVLSRLIHDAQETDSFRLDIAERGVNLPPGVTHRDFETLASPHSAVKAAFRARSTAAMARFLIVEHFGSPSRAAAKARHGAISTAARVEARPRLAGTRRKLRLERPGEWLPLVSKCNIVSVIKTHDEVNNDTGPGPGSDSRSPCRPR